MAIGRSGRRSHAHVRGRELLESQSRRIHTFWPDQWERSESWNTATVVLAQSHIESTIYRPAHRIASGKLAHVHTYCVRCRTTL